MGGLIESFGEEMLWHINQSSTSAGQKTMYLISKLANVLKKMPTTDELIAENLEKRKEVNEIGQKKLDAMMRYYEKHLVRDTALRPTLLLDEMDKSLDLFNVIALYTDVLPAIARKFNVQIIVVSHSPVVLLDKIFHSPDYNIVSMSNTYTRNCRKSLKTLI